ncbi:MULTISPECIES: LAETG motif-containing sortase-dependent surface protein [unclassified Streptomyces]|uniref:LAETG motif-containing sortase-dependent surface protein n=1 Tax=unclassified Streptomyces TaxID=2593676 RepID=UPI002DD8F7D5|nr:LAETG motif-containing sortase-dependent surface protein [Streptomyces sp. NBC_01445]WSE05603.1 LPXTG cell wall anchor domain-containing protein [Streptomyces sp. NBC_01445]
MKLRRALAAAAATAAIAPIALLSAPAAFADETPDTTTVTTETPSTPAETPPSTPATPSSPETTPSTPESPSTPASTPATTPASTPSGTPSDSTSPSPSATPSDEPTDPTGICEEDNEGYQSKLSVSISGLPGKIAAGSGWHGFTLNVKNPTKTDLDQAIFYAGVGPNDENAENPYKASEVRLQAKVDGTWVDIDDGDGYSFGFLDLSGIKAGKSVNYQLRLNVKAGAPIGEGLTIGGGFYNDDELNCEGEASASYLIQIVKPGTDTDGTKPQEGGKVPMPTEKPNDNNTQEVTGSLAETGSSSMVPTIGLIGGVAVVAGAGAVFTVRRRKAGATA